MFIRFALRAATFCGTVAILGCGPGDVQTGAAPASDGGYVNVKGSDTMVHLTSLWSEAFAEVNPKIEVSVTGGGSGTGFAALLNGTTDLSMASRPIKEKEVVQAQANGIEPMEYVVARDGIALVVNPANPVDELTLEQLMKIFTGATDSWKPLGGTDEGIVILSRESSSGTYVFFQEHVLQKKDYATTALLMPATSSIIQNVSEDKTSIGYVGLGYALDAGDRVKIVKIKTSADAESVTPSEATVKSGAYPISRPLHLYSHGTPTEKVQAFLDFCLGTKGQEIVREAGYVTAQ